MSPPRTQPLERFLLTAPGTERFPLFVQRVKIGGAYREHSHDFTEIDIILSGTAEHVVNGEAFAVRPGDVCVFHGGASHGYRRGRDLEVYDLMYQPHLLQVDWSPLRWLTGYRRLFGGRAREAGGAGYPARLHLARTDQTRLYPVIETMLAEQAAAQPGWETALTAGLLQVVLQLTRLAGTEQAPRPSLREQLDALIAAIEAHPEEVWTVARLAERCALHPSTFIRAFTAHVGLTPLEYVLQRRMEYACRLLTATDRPVGEIATACGFGDSNYFARAFRQRLHVSPSGFRAGRRR